jgi:hypothetical protein
MGWQQDYARLKGACAAALRAADSGEGTRAIHSRGEGGWNSPPDQSWTGASPVPKRSVTSSRSVRVSV